MFKKRIALFASGNGSNALRIIDYFKDSSTVSVEFVLSNKQNAPVIERVKELGIETIVISNEEAEDSELLLRICKEHNIDFVVLAGYLRKIPADFVANMPERIVNIHPSLLPKFGGKGMYGIHVHRAVKESNESETGITIHFVNEEFDKGKIIAQYKTTLSPNDSVEVIQTKIHQLEQTYFPVALDKLLAS